MEYGNLGKDVDYSRWERKSLPGQKVKFSMPSIDEIESYPFHPSSSEKRRVSQSQGHRGANTITMNVAENGLSHSKDVKTRDFDGQPNPSGSTSSPLSTRKIESACSSLCRHLPRQDQGKGTLVEEEENLDLVQTMKFQIKGKKQCVQEYKRQILKLMEDNVRLKKHIQSTEASCHNDVKEQLKRYNKLRGAVENITNEHAKHKVSINQSFSEVKRSTSDHLRELEKIVSNLKKEVRRKQNSLRTLNNFKNKEYPEKTLRIKRLRRELETLSQIQGKDLKEVNQVIDSETAKYKKNAEKDSFKVLESAAFLVYDTVDANVKEISYQNTRLKKEIEMQKLEKGRLEIENLELERKIESLIESIKTLKTDLYPGVYQMTEKCMPDTEIELSIPRQKYLPI